MNIYKILVIFSLLFLFSCQNNSSNDEVSLIENKIILSIWDSITAWYSLALEETYPAQLESMLRENNYDYEVINAWVSWDTSMELLERIDLYLNDDELLPDIAILVIGWNDWLRWKSIDELAINIELIIDRLQEKNIKVVLWWMKIPPNLGLSYSNDFYKVYKKIADEKDVYRIDFFLDWVAWYRNLNLNDWIHPNKEGYKIISTNVFEFLKSKKLIKND